MRFNDFEEEGSDATDLYEPNNLRVGLLPHRGLKLVFMSQTKIGESSSRQAFVIMGYVGWHTGVLNGK